MKPSDDRRSKRNERALHTTSAPTTHESDLASDFHLMVKTLFSAVFLFSTLCLGQTEAAISVESASTQGSDAATPTQTGAGPTSLSVPQLVGDKSEVVTKAPPAVVTKSTAARVAEKSPFQKFIEDAAGSDLPVYGSQLFSQGPTTFAPIDRVPVPINYVIGPGDELLIRAWGKIDLQTRSTVDRNGQISLPKVGAISVAGLRYDQLQGFLHSAIGALYKDFELNVTMGQLRSIQIYVLGSASQPGAYTVSSLSTLVNALFASGGPSATGTMRHIKLRRGDKEISDFDLYDLLRKGDKSHDVPLLPGDVIYIPPVGPQIALSGSVNEPGIYELKGKTDIHDALEMAGGLTSIANVQRATLERLDNRATRSFDELALDADGLQRPLKDGDLLSVSVVSPKYENVVTLRGNVANPGRYAWKEGMRVSDLIPSRDSLITSAYWSQKNHQASSGIITASTSSEINWEYAVIERIDDRDLSPLLLPFRLASAIEDRGSPDNRVLKAGDVISIFSRTDIDLPVGKYAAFVHVGGEVNAPGEYRITPGETLRDLVAQAGGLTSRSYLYASKLTRVSTRKAQEEQLKAYTDQMQREIISRSVRASSPGDQQAALAGTDSLQKAITALSSIAPTGRVVLKMKPSATTVEDIPDFALEDGDEFNIPTKQNTVEVAGAVYNQSSFKYQPGKRAFEYLNDAGGATRDADKAREFVIRADGSLLSKQSRVQSSHGSFDKLVLLPGDALLLPTKVKGTSLNMEGLSNALQFVSTAAVLAATLSILK